MDARTDWIGFLRERGQRLADIGRTPLNTPFRFYLTGFVLVIMGAVLGGFIDPFWYVVLAFGLGMICIGFLQELWAKVKALLASSTAHKVLGAFGSVVIALPCYILANQSVNQITGLSPEPFTYSISLLAISYALPVMLTASAVLLVGYSCWQLLTLTWRAMRTHIGMFAVIFSGELPKMEKERDFLSESRTLAAVTLMGVSFYATDLYNQAEETLQQIRAAIVVGADYYPRSPCDNVAGHERVAFLKDGKISVATRAAGRWSFRLVTCEMAQQRS